MRLDLVTHIAAGALGIGSGFVALAVAKGARAHRTSGVVFVYAMLTMALVGGVMALVYDKAPEANTQVALLTMYLVITALTTVRQSGRSFDIGLMVLAFGVSLTLYTFGGVAIVAPKRAHGFPAAPFFVFGTIAVLAAIGDLRLVRAGGVQTIRGAPRLTRHLWRMCTALLIAAFSFFLGQAKVFPKPIRIFPVLAVPPLIVLGALVYWLWRVRVRRQLRGMVVTRTAEAVGTT